MKNILHSLLLIGLFMLTPVVQAHDWANLKRFQQENLNLPEAAPGEDREVFMGNSITEGWSKKRPRFFINKAYVNRDISGQTTPQMLLRFRQDVIELQPAVVVVLAGINDIAGNTGPTAIDAIANNIISTIQLAQANEIEVVMFSVLPASYFPWKPDMKPGEKVIELNTILMEYALANHCVYVDLRSAMVNDELALKKEFGYDGVHPNAKGYFVMEPLVEAGIKKALEKRQ